MSVILSAGQSASGPALRLRPWLADDAVDLAAAFRDPILRRFLLRTSIDSEADARRWIDVRAEEWAAGTRFSFAVLELLAGTDDVSGPVGYVSVKGMASGKGSAEVGYWTSAGARGRGIASRAVEAMSVWTFAAQPIERLELLHSVDNLASCRVARACEFLFHSVLAADPPTFPVPGHLHVRTKP
jgi:RimJ/RimL family protein N-acetyltransferase